MVVNERLLGTSIYLSLQAECYPDHHATPRLASAVGQLQRTLHASLAAIMQGPIACVRQAVSPVWTVILPVANDERDRGRPSVFVFYVHFDSITFVEFSGVLYHSRVSLGGKIPRFKSSH